MTMAFTKDFIFLPTYYFGIKYFLSEFKNKILYTSQCCEKMQCQGGATFSSIISKVQSIVGILKKKCEKLQKKIIKAIFQEITKNI